MISLSVRSRIRKRKSRQQLRRSSDRIDSSAQTKRSYCETTTVRCRPARRINRVRVSKSTQTTSSRSRLTLNNRKRRKEKKVKTIRLKTVVPKTVVDQCTA
uniref:(northern house mosquito) hypothetical protein n=1 Tax=Culex pipiens TaxID=7175 RepID=A0A8D8FTZ3_CULPI